MSVQNLFNFSRPLPKPFDTLSNKKVSVQSKYGEKTSSTLCASVIKAVLAVCKCRAGEAPGAVGLIDHRSVVEYKSSEADMYHLAVYDPSSGNIMASIVNKNVMTHETYVLHKTKRDGSAIVMAMLPALMEDEEFQETFDKYYDAYQSGYPDMKAATEHMAILCDNAYRRVKDDTCAAHIKSQTDNAGNLTRISQSHIDSGHFNPTILIDGEFEIFAQMNAAPIITPVVKVDKSDFAGKYAFNTQRVLSAYEQTMVPTIEDWYILPPEIINCCKHAKASTGKAASMRNFMLRGPAGTGKTAGARAIAAGLGLPYVKYTCSANTEIFDLVGQLFPDTDIASTGDQLLDEERRQLKDMGGMTFENVSRLMKLPGLDDLDYDPAGVYSALTGTEKQTATTQECMALIMQTVTDKVQKLSRVKPDSKNTAGQTYTYTETDFIRALKHGYVIEVQEPSTIMQPGVLVGLNSLLEQSGSITLPTGEIIQRHPDAVVIITTNIDYEGCRALNQSVIDRMSLIMDIELPSPEVMAQRAMSVTDFDDDITVSRMVQVVNDMAKYCRANGITDGSCGMRSLIDWIISTEITGDPYLSALHTVVSKATTDSDDRERLITAVLEPMFAPKRQKAV